MRSTAFLFLFLFLIACTRQKVQEATENILIDSPVSHLRVDSVIPDHSIIENIVPVKDICYDVIPLSTEMKKNIDSFYSPEQLKIILVLNRIDSKHLWRVDSLVVPDTFTDILAYSPFPDTLLCVCEIKKLLIFSYRIQAFAVYENGKQIRWGPVSMGKKSTPTPTGLFYTNWKSKETTSTVDSEWVMKWYFNLINFQGVSMHEYDLPGFPASHACVRLYEEDAKWLYDWAEQWVLSPNDTILAHGTPVLIYGMYAFDEGKPWRQLPEDNHYTDQIADSLQMYLEPYLPVIKERQSIRETLLYNSQVAF